MSALASNRERAAVILAEQAYERARRRGDIPPGPCWEDLPAPERMIWLRHITCGLDRRGVPLLRRAVLALAARGSRIVRKLLK